MSAAETAAEPITPRKQFGLQQVMWMVVSVAVVMAIGTQGGFAGIVVAVGLALVLASACWSWYARNAYLFLACIVVVPILTFLFLPQLYPERRPSPLNECRSNLRMLTLALQNYAYANDRHFPPAYIADENGKPMHSWRVLILPYLDQEKIYQQYRFDKPWDSSHNLKIAQQIPRSLFLCPTRSRSSNSLFTSYVAVVGDETMWPGARSVTLDEITDGTTNTLCLIEWPESDIIWTEPRDFDSDRHWLLTNPPAPLLESKSRHQDGVHVAFADGHVEFISFHKLPGHTVRALFSRTGEDDASWRD